MRRVVLLSVVAFVLGVFSLQPDAGKLPTPSFQLLRPDAQAGVANLDANLCINGTCVTPTFRYYGGDATTSAWPHDTYGESLTAAGSGGTVNAGSPFYGADDDSVNPDGTRYWKASGNDFADVTTEDMVFEIVFKYNSAGAAFERLLNKRVAGNEGYMIDARNTNNRIALVIEDGATNTQTVQTAASLTEGVWYYAIVFVDRSGSAQWYVNGAVSNSADDVSSVGSLTAAKPFTIAATDTGVTVYDSNIAYLAMYIGDAWLDTHLQADVAQERTQHLLSLYPQIASGDRLWATYTRATTAHVDKVEYGSELLPEPIDLSHNDWSKAQASVTEATGVTTPDGVQAYNLHEDDTEGDVHRIQDIQSSTADVTVYDFSVDIKANNRDWVFLRLYQTDKTGYAYFNASTGTIGTTSNILDSSVESLGDGWYRCSIRKLTESSNAQYAAIFVASADGSSTFNGADQDSLYIANATVKEFERKLYLMGAGAPRVCYRQEDTDSSDFYGYLAETAATNLFTDSADFTQASWTKTRATIEADSIVVPDGSTGTTNTLAEDGTAANSHVIYGAFTQAASTPYTLSFWLKAINRNWAQLQLWSATDGYAWAYFNLSTGTVGTESGNDSAGIQDWGNGWFRCWIRDTRTTAEAGYAYINIAEADNDIVFDGGTQDSLYVWGAQLEADVDAPTSYIPTSGGTATRNADVLYYKGDDGNVVNNQRGTMQVDVLLPDVDQTVNQYSFVNLSDGGASTDRIYVYSNANDNPSVQGKNDNNTEWLLVGTTDVVSGNRTTARVTWKTNSANLYIDGSSEGTPDTSCTPPDDLDRIEIGIVNSSICQPNGLLRDIKIWPYPTTQEQ